MSDTAINESNATMGDSEAGNQENQASKSNSVGKVTEIKGAVVDVQFTGELPYILNALT